MLGLLLLYGRRSTPLALLLLPLRTIPAAAGEEPEEALANVRHPSSPSPSASACMTVG